MQADGAQWLFQLSSTKSLGDEGTAVGCLIAASMILRAHLGLGMPVPDLDGSNAAISRLTCVCSRSGPTQAFCYQR